MGMSECIHISQLVLMRADDVENVFIETHHDHGWVCLLILLVLLCTVKSFGKRGKEGERRGEAMLISFPGHQ